MAATLKGTSLTAKSWGYQIWAIPFGRHNLGARCKFQGVYQNRIALVFWMVRCIQGKYFMEQRVIIY